MYRQVNIFRSEVSVLFYDISIPYLRPVRTVIYNIAKVVHSLTLLDTHRLNSPIAVLIDKLVTFDSAEACYSVNIDAPRFIVGCW